MKTLKYIMFLCWMIALSYVYGTTRTVALDGTQQYTSIQGAINACSNSDIVQVYPGEYFEHLNTSSKSITIQSLYPITHEDETINTTIIHSTPQFSCLKVNNQESVTIDGLTMMNNYPENLGVNLSGSSVAGGAINCYNQVSVRILNCIIKHCIGGGSGGIYFEGTNFFMSNTRIFDNYGIDLAGGLCIYGNYANSIEFDSVHKNSIYGNTARSGVDVAIYYCTIPIVIEFQTFSIILSEPDDYFFNEAENNGITLSVQEAYYNLVNHDLYVSPDGDNDNSGLSSDSPLQTIAYAAKIIASDSLNPKTIYLAPGVYNFSDANQYFPFSLKSHTRLIGSSMDDTILDCEQAKRNYLGSGVQSDVVVENITFSPTLGDVIPLGFGGCTNITLRNLKFDGTFGNVRIAMNGVDNALFENIIVSNATINDLNLGFRLYFCDNIVLNKILIDNLVITGTMANFMGFYLNESDVVLRNSIISNCEGYDASVLSYQNKETAQSEYNFEMTNTLIYNNHSYGSLLWSLAPVSITNKFQRMRVDNCTIANNKGYNTRAMFIRGDCDITNSIFSNPDNYRDFVFYNVYMDFNENEEEVQYTHHPSINYSLLRKSYSASDTTLVTINNVMRNIDPLFLGSFDSTPDITQPEYYLLNSHSPCINAGTPDSVEFHTLPTDLAGNYRIWNNRIDMGCYEYGSEPVGNDDPVYPVQPDRITLSTYPNPVYLNGKKGAYTFIEFTLPEKAKAKPVIEIYNLKGQKVRTMQAGESMNSMARKAGVNNYELRITNDELESGTGKGEAKSSLPQNRKGFTNASSNAASAESAFGSPNDRDGRLTNKQDAYATESYSTVWDCRDDRSQTLATGIYIVKVTSGRLQTSSKITILK